MPDTSSCGPKVTLDPSGAYRAIVTCKDFDIAGSNGAVVNLPCSTNNITGNDAGYVYFATFATPFANERESGLEFSANPAPGVWWPYIRVKGIKGITGDIYYSVNPAVPPIYLSSTDPPPNWDYSCSDPAQTYISILTEEQEGCGASHSGPWPCSYQTDLPYIDLVYVACEYNSTTQNCAGGYNVSISYIKYGAAGATKVGGYPYWTACGQCIAEYITSVAYGTGTTPSSLGAVFWSSMPPTSDILACVNNPPWFTSEPNQKYECMSGPPMGGNPVVQVPFYGTDYNGFVEQNVYINATH